MLAMKTILLTLLLMVTGFCVKAQPYESIFGQTSTEWVFRWANTGGVSVDTFFIEGDTILHGTAYKILSVKSSSHFKVGFLREDTVVGKVWYKGLDLNGGISPSDTVEKLAFNFSLQQGDSVDVSNVNIGGPNGYPPFLEYSG